MKEQNGIQILEGPNDGPSLGPELEELDLTYFHLPYGTKVVEINGKKKLMAATLTDYQESEGKRLGVAPSTIKAPLEGLACNQVGLKKCPVAQCGAFQKCTALYNPVYKYYYCQCMQISDKMGG
jgi:hypothetical protein